MTDLELSLIAIGVTIVGGVLIYNKWQEYRAKKSVERAFSSEHDDVLMKQRPGPDEEPLAESGNRQEPSFGNETPMEPMYANEVADEEDDFPNTEPMQHDAPVQPPLPVDDMVDCLIPVGLAGKLRGERVLQAAQSL